MGAIQRRERSVYAYRLGNLILLDLPLNIRVGDSEWGEKRRRIRDLGAAQTPRTVAPRD